MKTAKILGRGVRLISSAALAGSLSSCASPASQPSTPKAPEVKIETPSKLPAYFLRLEVTADDLKNLAGSKPNPLMGLNPSLLNDKTQIQEANIQLGAISSADGGHCPKDSMPVVGGIRLKEQFTKD